MEPRPWHRHYDADVPAELAFEELTLPELLRRSSERGPERTAIRFENLRLSYERFQEEVDRCSQAFAALGVGHGTSIAIHMPNVPQVPIAYYGALQLGARVVLTNPLYTPREIAHQWQDAECELAVTMDFLWDQKVRDLRGELPVRNYVVASIPEYLRFPLDLLAPLKLRRQDPPAIARVEAAPDVHRFKALLRRHRPRRPERGPTLDDVAVLQYTGGTTGVSKAATLSHRNLSCNAQQTVAWCSSLRPGEEVVLTCLPLFHVFGMTVCMNLATTTGSAMVLIANPRDTGALVRAIEKRRVTIFPAVPAIINNLNHHAAFGRADVASLRVCISGSAPIAEDVQRRFETTTGATLVEGYGLSETSPLTHANPVQGRRKLGSIGIPVSSTDARVVDVDDPAKELADGEEGELALSGPQVMEGYWKRPDETAQCMRGAWFLTGDLAVRDEDGYFRIVGRKKDMINIKGMKVYPDEIDEVLMGDARILEAATIGVPDERHGESVKAFVVLQPGASLDADEVIAICRENLAPYKVPREVEFLDELPKSTVLKVLRRELRDRELARRRGG